MKRHNTANLNVGKAIHTILSEVLPSYPCIAEQTANYPFSTYRRIGFIPRNTKDMYNYVEEATIEVNIAATTYSESISLAQQVKDAMEHNRGRYEDVEIADIEMVDASENWVNEAYVQTMRFTVALNSK